MDAVWMEGNVRETSTDTGVTHRMSPPSVTHQTETGARTRTRTWKQGCSRLAGSAGIHLQLPSVPPCLERAGEGPGGVGDPQGMGGAESLWGERDQQPNGSNVPVG